MSPSTNKLSGSIENITISNESTTITTLTSHFVTQTNFPTTITNIIKYLLANFDDKNFKKYAKFKETIEESTADQDEKFDAKFENQIQTLSLQIKEE